MQRVGAGRCAPTGSHLHISLEHSQFVTTQRGECNCGQAKGRLTGRASERTSIGRVSATQKRLGIGCLSFSPRLGFRCQPRQLSRHQGRRRAPWHGASGSDRRTAAFPRRHPSRPAAPTKALARAPINKENRIQAPQHQGGGADSSLE